MRKQSKCKACGADIARNTKICPSCGAKNRTSHPVFALIGCAIVLLICIPLIINMASEISPSSQGVSGSSEQIESDSSTDEVIVLTMLLVSLVALIAVVFTVPPVLKARKKYGKSEFLFQDKFKFAGGLNLPQNVTCSVICLMSRVVFVSSGQEFSLPTEKLVNVSIQTATQIQKQYVSSVGGAVAGALLLGPLGAVIGGAANKRSIKLNTKYLIFTYRDSEEIKYVLLDVTQRLPGARKFEREFKNLRKNDSIKTEL